VFPRRHGRRCFKDGRTAHRTATGIIPPATGCVRHPGAAAADLATQRPRPELPDSCLSSPAPSASPKSVVDRVARSLLHTSQEGRLGLDNAAERRTLGGVRKCMMWWLPPAHDSMQQNASGSGAGWASSEIKLHGRWNHAPAGRGDGTPVIVIRGQRTNEGPDPRPASVCAFSQKRVPANHRRGRTAGPAFESSIENRGLKSRPCPALTSSPAWKALLTTSKRSPRRRCAICSPPIPKRFPQECRARLAVVFPSTVEAPRPDETWRLLLALAQQADVAGWR